MLVREVEELLYGNEEKFKSLANTSTLLNESAGGLSKPKVAKPTYAMPVANTSHLDAVPQATPVNRNRVVYKKVRTFPMCFDDADPAAVHENAQLPEVLVPIRLGMISRRWCQIFVYFLSSLTKQVACAHLVINVANCNK